MIKRIQRGASALLVASLLAFAPQAMVYADDSAAETKDAEFSSLMMEVAASAGDAEEVQKAAQDAYNASLSAGNSEAISTIIANQTIVNMAFLEADTDEEVQNALDAANQLEAQSAEEEKKIEESAEQAAEESAEASKEAAKEAAESTGASNVSESDRKLLAAIIYCEAGNQSMEGKIAVGNVVLNRVKSSRFPDTISEVIYQKGQFTPAGSGWLNSVLRKNSIPESCYEAADRALAGERPVGDSIYFMRTYLHSSGIIIGAHCFWGSL